MFRVRMLSLETFINLVTEDTEASENRPTKRRRDSSRPDVVDRRFSRSISRTERTARDEVLHNV